jgi:nucleoside-diphosphate-sugar epimerase
LNTIFITGSTGFVGVNLLEYLSRHHHQVVGVSRFKNTSDGIIDYVEFEKKLKWDGKSVIHLAGKAHDLKKVSSPADYYEANFELTRYVFDAFLQSEASVFVFMSTVKAVADKVEGVLTEDVIPNPQTHYGITKQQAEQYILGKEIPKGKRVYILRPCMIHGPENKGNLNLLYQLVSKGLPWPLGSFQNQRSFLSIENLCFVIKELLENTDIPSGVYQVADDQVLSTNELIQLLGTSLVKKSTVLKISPSWIKIMARLGDNLHLPLNSERLQKLTENYRVSNAKIVAAMGKSLPVSSKEGLLKTFESFKS